MDICIHESVQTDPGEKKNLFDKCINILWCCEMEEMRKLPDPQKK